MVKQVMDNSHPWHVILEGKRFSAQFGGEQSAINHAKLLINNNYRVEIFHRNKEGQWSFRHEWLGGKKTK